jgi:hypothetical protein
LLSPGAEIDNNDNNGTTASIINKHKSRGGANIEAAVGADCHAINNRRELPIHSITSRRGISAVHTVIFLSTSSWRTSVGFVLPTLVLVLLHFMLGFSRMCWVRRLSWNSLSIWLIEILHCSVIVTKTVHYLHYRSVSGESLQSLH